MLRFQAISVVLLGLLLVMALPIQQAVGVDQDDATEILESLLGLTVERHATALAAMHGWGALYGNYRSRAAAGEPDAVRVWLLIAFTTLARGDAATSEAFSSDLIPVYRRQPEAVLDALSDNLWLAPTTCYFLGAYFDFEDRAGEGRQAFLTDETQSIQAALPEAAAERCLRQIESPERPGP